MRVLPILFNTDMVKAILDNRKTVTRRLPSSFVHARYDELCEEAGALGLPCATEREFYEQHPPFEVNDVLYVRETWAKCQNAESYIYKADFDGYAAEVFLPGMKWHPSIHMPKAAARIWLRVTDVRVERLQKRFFEPPSAIFDLQAEGIDVGVTCRNCISAYGCPCCNDEDTEGGSECGMLDDVRDDFARLWDTTVKPVEIDQFGWAANPWVWVIKFERCEKPEVA